MCWIILLWTLLATTAKEVMSTWPTRSYGQSLVERDLRDILMRGAIIPEPDMTFENEGKVIEFEVYLHELVTTNDVHIRLQIWRPVRHTEPHIVQLVGQTPWQTHTQEGYRKFRLRPDQHIRVRPGDMYGFGFVGPSAIPYDVMESCDDAKKVLNMPLEEPIEPEMQYTFARGHDCHNYSIRIQSKEYSCEELWATSEEGIIMSPNYPGYYPNNHHSCWRIRARTGQIQLTADEIHTEFCYDYIQVFDGPLTTSRQLGTWCGNTESRVTSSGSTLLIVFSTDESVSSFGFVLLHEEINPRDCVNLSASQDMRDFQSPLWPDPYPPNENICWLIMAVNPMDHVMLHFTTFELEGDSPCNPRKDYLRISDGATAANRSLGRFCGHDMPGDVISSGDSLFLDFRSNAHTTGAGFRVEYFVAPDVEESL